MKWFIKPILVGLAEAVGLGLFLTLLYLLGRWIVLRDMSNAM